MSELTRQIDKKLITPIYIKKNSEESWPEDQVFYILAGNGLFLCRNQEFFTSSVPVEGGPSALPQQETFLKSQYPPLSRSLLEVAVGFFAVVYEIYGAEAAVLLLWNRSRRRYQLMVPQQRSIVFESWSGSIFPLNVHYEVPVNLPPEQYVIGDIHSHCEAAAFSSVTDQHDETHRTGLHIVVGHLHKEPPQFHVEAVVDGKRFKIMPESILGGYRRRQKAVPPAWIRRVQIETRRSGFVWSNNDYDDGERSSCQVKD